MKKLLMIIVAFLMVTGCGTYRQSVQVDDNAYLLLIGEPAGNIVTIDNGKPIELGKETESFDLNGKIATKIQVPIGTHTLKVTKDGDLVVNRKFYVSTGGSFEVQL
jgi:uncharacterized lipoprotein YajG